MSTRTRGQDGQWAALRAKVLLALTRAARATISSGHEARGSATAAGLAETLNVASSQVHVALRGLLQTGCVRPQPHRGARAGAQYSGARCYQLAHREEERGAGRRSRMYPVALVVGMEPASAEPYCTALQSGGTLPLAVASEDEAALLLQQMAFEYLIVNCAVDEPGVSPLEATRLHRAAREAGCGEVMMVRAQGPIPYALSVLRSDARSDDLFI